MEGETEDTAYSLEDTHPVGDFKYEFIQEKECFIPIVSYLSVRGLTRDNDDTDPAYPPKREIEHWKRIHHSKTGNLQKNVTCMLLCERFK